MKTVIIGAGAFGLALAQNLSKTNQITVWSALKEEITNLKNNGISEKLPNIILNKEINYEENLEIALKNKDLIIIAVPFNFIRNTVNKIKPYYQNTPICVASKGIENETGLFAHEIIKEILNTKISVISGPSFAKDLAKENAALTIANPNETVLNVFQNLKIEKTNDIIGVEICGAFKNIIAISAGILNGLNKNESIIASYMTDWINQTKTLIKNLNGNENTIFTYAGIGDILLTANSKSSRNFTFGEILSTKNSKEINNYIKNNTIEGLYALKSFTKLLEKKDIKVPLINKINPYINAI